MYPIQYEMKSIRYIYKNYFCLDSRIFKRGRIYTCICCGTYNTILFHPLLRISKEKRWKTVTVTVSNHSDLLDMFLSPSLPISSNLYMTMARCWCRETQFANQSWHQVEETTRRTLDLHVKVDMNLAMAIENFAHNSFCASKWNILKCHLPNVWWQFPTDASIFWRDSHAHHELR